MKIWIDTDCGVDDSTAILLALDCPECEIVGISCVGGNASIDNVERNVHRTLSLYGRGTDIPVFRGCDRSLLAEHMHIPSIHGNDGLGDVDDKAYGINAEFKTPTEHAVSAMIRAAKENPGLVIVTIGPLTNVAHAVHMDPRAFDGVEKMVIMGGAVDGPGNVTPYAEFNIRCDPEAFAIVLKHFPQSKIILSTWTLTVKNAVSGQDLQECFYGTETLLQMWTHQTWQGCLRIDKNTACLADPIAMLIALYPDIVEESSRRKLSVVLSGEKIGMVESVSDEDGACVPTKINKENAVNYLKALLSRK